ncbi:hypothetical protein B296_00037977 [Ensete ventricosum]|uniref:RING-type domain-containing protein n=1 Tax=Ensete ventricosum TaxID=4639 RepID=A0A426ZXZ3_ENSVE|nr:hypothetical protein B296_00037977 [Ensete ventricosum]
MATESGLQSLIAVDDIDLCAVCLERACSKVIICYLIILLFSGCGHELCIQCALYLCSTSNTSSEIVGLPGSIPCPFCRHGIISFVKLPSTRVKGFKPNLALSLCNPCILHPCALDVPVTCRSEVRRNRVAAVSSEIICPLTCAPFASGVIPSCNCDDDPCPSNGSQGEVQAQSSRSLHITSEELEKMEEQRVDASCSGMFWGRRSCHREHQCNSEINA